MSEHGLKRSLGLWSVLAVSIGAMLGSGIFVLPGLAAGKAGPAAALAYVVAGLVVLPAALSKAEMATAMPEAGGTYLFIDKSMGPRLGTVAGLGVWFSLIFKASFALAGLGEYLSIFGEVPAKAIALVLAVALTGLNVVGAKMSGRVQTTVVLLVLGGLAAFVPFAALDGSPANLTPFIPKGGSSVLATAALVFVSYAGVTKIASISEEVKDPSRNIPLGMLVPLGLMVILYPLVTLAMIGVTDASTLAQTTTPIADVAGVVFGDWGLWLMAGLAVLALISMANAGVLASSRYPFAMARNGLAPSRLNRVHPRTDTPMLSVAVTGALLFILIAVFPLTELAKLASGFQLLVFAMVNLAPIAFRSSGVAYYQPTFRSPFYPWVQLFGIFASLVLLTQLGTVPLVGSGLIVVAGLAWYRGFGRSRASRESALLDALRIRENERVISETAALIEGGGNRHTLVLARHNVSPSKAGELVHLGQQLLHPDGHQHFLRLERSSDTVGTDLAWDRILPGDAPPKTQLTFDEPGARRQRHSVVDHIQDIGVDLLLSEMPPDTRRSHGFIQDVRWISDHVDCDTVLLRYRGLEAINRIVILGSGGPADTVKVAMANKIAVAEEGTIRFVHVVDDIASDEQIEFIHDYQRRLGDLCQVEVESLVPRSAGLMSAIAETASDADLVIVGSPSTPTHRFTLADRIMDTVEAPVAVVHVHAYERQELRRRFLQFVMH